jgi:hydroxymethylpyrimidine pyrophosphatase-like HAD family hydrolase
MKIIYVDIDETICKTNENRSYDLAQPINENIEKINKLYEQGNTIVYWTSRGSRKQIDWFELTKSQLDSWGAKYHELRCDKPYYDLFIDDKTLRIEEI